MSGEKVPADNVDWQAVRKWACIIYVCGAIFTFFVTGFVFAFTTTSGFAALALTIGCALLWPLAIFAPLYH